MSLDPAPLVLEKIGALYIDPNLPFAAIIRPSDAFKILK